MIRIVLAVIWFAAMVLLLLVVFGVAIVADNAAILAIGGALTVLLAIWGFDAILFSG